MLINVHHSVKFHYRIIGLSSFVCVMNLLVLNPLMARLIYDIQEGRVLLFLFSIQGSGKGSWEKSLAGY